MNEASPVIVMVDAAVDVVARLAATVSPDAALFVVGDAELADTYAEFAPSAVFVPGSPTALAALAGNLGERRIGQLVLAALAEPPSRKSRFRRVNREELASEAARSSLQTQAAAFERLAGHLAPGATVTFVVPAESARYDRIVTWMRDGLEKLHSMFEGQPDPDQPLAVRVPDLHLVGLVPVELDAVAQVWHGQIVAGVTTSGVVKATQVPGLGVPEVPETPADDEGFADDTAGEDADAADAGSEWSFAAEQITTELPAVAAEPADEADGDLAWGDDIPAGTDELHADTEVEVDELPPAQIASPDAPLSVQFTGSPLPPPAWPAPASALADADRDAERVRAEAAAFAARVRETAHQEATQVVGTAQTEATHILGEAREAAEATRQRAAATAEQLVSEAQATAERTLADARSDAAEVHAAAARVRSEADVYARDVEHRCEALAAEAEQMLVDAGADRDAAADELAAAAAERAAAERVSAEVHELLAFLTGQARTVGAAVGGFVAALEERFAAPTEAEEVVGEVEPVVAGDGEDTSLGFDGAL